MEKKRVALMIEGQPGVEVTVFPKNEGEAPPEPPYSGHLDGEGRLTISLPPAKYAIVSPAHKTQPVELQGEDESQTVRLKDT